MRDQLITLLKALTLGTFRVSTELPYSNSGTALYVKNTKSIYVDNPQQETGNFLQTLAGCNIDQTVTTIQVYFTSDAKQLPSNYASLVTSIRALKDATAFADNNVRECTVSTEYLNDNMLTEFEFRFTKIS